MICESIFSYKDTLSNGAYTVIAVSKDGKQSDNKQCIHADSLGRPSCVSIVFIDPSTPDET